MTTTPTQDADHGGTPVPTRASPAPPAPRGATRQEQEVSRGVTTARVVHAELIKLRSLWSTTYALVVAAVSIVGMAAFTAVGVLVGQVPESGATGDPTTDPTGGALSGVNIAYFAVATLGVLAVTGEYGSSMIKSSMAAVPRRSRLVVGKAVAVAAVTLPVTVLSTVVAFFAAKAILASAGVNLSFAEPGAARAVIGAGAYLAGIALLGTAFGWLLRSTAGALATLFAVLILVPTLGLLLPVSVGEKVLPYLADNAGQAIMATTPSSGQLGPWTGLAVFAAWIAVALVGAALLLRHRDA